MQFEHLWLSRFKIGYDLFGSQFIIVRAFNIIGYYYLVVPNYNLIHKGIYYPLSKLLVFNIVVYKLLKPKTDFVIFKFQWLIQFFAINAISKCTSQKSSQVVEILKIETLKKYIDKIMARFYAKHNDVYKISQRETRTNNSKNYKMTEIEKHICEMIGSMLEEYLNALLNGLVIFDVDTYFTAKALRIGKCHGWQ